jgi:ketosteroid isomerase-like protein
MSKCPSTDRLWVGALNPAPHRGIEHPFSRLRAIDTLSIRSGYAPRKTWDLFFRYHKPSQAFDIEELAITAGEDVAFAVAIMRCGSATSSGPPEEGGFLFRLTIGLRKIDGRWRVAHEHHSVP